MTAMRDRLVTAFALGIVAGLVTAVLVAKLVPARCPDTPQQLQPPAATIE